MCQLYKIETFVKIKHWITYGQAQSMLTAHIVVNLYHIQCKNRIWENEGKLKSLSLDSWRNDFFPYPKRRNMNVAM